MSDDRARQLREVQAFFRLPSLGLVEKDVQVVRAIAAIATLDATPFTLIFGGGTALARAHKIVRRMSEDIDFKIVPQLAAFVSRSILRQQLGALRQLITPALQAAGFAFDPAEPGRMKSRNENRNTVWNLPYDAAGGAGHGLRPTIQIEMTYATLRISPVTLPVRSFVAEAHKEPPEVAAIGCVSLVETAAEKLVALTRRTAMELAGLSRNPDPALVRHIYDLHAMRDLVDAAAVGSLATDIAAADAIEFRNQYPAYQADTAGETRKAVDVLQADPAYRRRYDDFISAMVYGDRSEYDGAVGTVLKFVEKMNI